MIPTNKSAKDPGGFAGLGRMSARDHRHNAQSNGKAAGVTSAFFD
jgi:hypothetical protein